MKVNGDGAKKKIQKTKSLPLLASKLNSKTLDTTKNTSVADTIKPRIVVKKKVEIKKNVIIKPKVDIKTKIEIKPKIEIKTKVERKMEVKSKVEVKNMVSRSKTPTRSRDIPIPNAKNYTGFKFAPKKEEEEINPLLLCLVCHGVPVQPKLCSGCAKSICKICVYNIPNPDCCPDCKSGFKSGFFAEKKSQSITEFYSTKKKRLTFMDLAGEAKTEKRKIENDLYSSQVFTTKYDKIIELTEISHDNGEVNPKFPFIKPWHM